MSFLKSQLTTLHVLLSQIFRDHATPFNRSIAALEKSSNFAVDPSPYSIVVCNLCATAKKSTYGINS
jgi:hypothetical protein